jgi:hypothetical protein
METTLLGQSMPTVLQQLRELLIRKGFLVQTMPTHDPVIVAYKAGNWLRKARQLIIEINSIDNNTTRLSITAIIDSAIKNKSAEANIEESFAVTIKNIFKKVTLS